MFSLYNSGKVRGVGECNKMGYLCVKCISHHFSLFIFLPIWEDKKSGSRRENFLPYFFAFPIFFSRPNNKKQHFSSYFPSPLISTT